MNATPKKASTVKTGRVLGVFFEQVKRYPWTGMMIVFGAAAASVFGVIAPIYYKRFFDLLQAPGSAEASGPYNPLLYVLGIALVLKLAGWICWRISLLPNINFDVKIMRNLTSNAFSKVLHHSYSFFSNTFVGSLVRKVGRLERSYETIWENVVHVVIPISISVVGILYVVFKRSTAIGFAFVAWLVIFLFANYLIFRWKSKYDERKTAADSAVTGTLSDSITNNISIKIFSGYSFEENLFGSATKELGALRKIGWTINEVIRTTQGFLSVAVEIAVMVWALMLYNKGQLTLGDFFLFQAYIVTLTNQVWNIGWMLRAFYEAIADAKEIVEIMDTPYEVQDIPNAGTLKVTQGKIDFTDVSFNFNETRKVLDGFSLSITPGEKVAFIGPSGAGKTTVTKLLFRFHDVTDGTILIDGQDISKMTQDSLRNAIALVPQEPILFHRSLMDNIRYGRRDATDEEVIEAAKKARCHEFISSLPDGYETMVGERGVKLSGGERQRVAIARAILKDAPILVLDEATSSLDSESEHLIQEALNILMEGKTVIVIAHRLSTIITMDRIIVIEGGNIRAMGTHDQLLKKDELYKKLWSIQAGGFLKEEE